MSQLHQKSLTFPTPAAQKHSWNHLQSLLLGWHFSIIICLFFLQFNYVPFLPNKPNFISSNYSIFLKSRGLDTKSFLKASLKQTWLVLRSGVSLVIERRYLYNDFFWLTPLTSEGLQQLLWIIYWSFLSTILLQIQFFPKDNLIKLKLKKKVFKYVFYYLN